MNDQVKRIQNTAISLSEILDGIILRIDVQATNDFSRKEQKVYYTGYLWIQTDPTLKPREFTICNDGYIFEESGKEGEDND